MTTINLALDEVKNQSFGTTQQILAFHKVKDLTLKHNFYVDELDTFQNVYFALEEYPYSLVITVSTVENEKKVIGSHIAGYSRVYLCIYSDTLLPNEISEKLGLTPTKSLLKNSFVPKTKIKVDQNQWYYEPQKKLPIILERKLDFLLKSLKPIAEIISSLPDGTSSCIHICYSGYTDWMGGWHFESDTLKQITALNAEIDFDLYASGPELL